MNLMFMFGTEQNVHQLLMENIIQVYYFKIS